MTHEEIGRLPGLFGAGSSIGALVETGVTIGVKLAKLRVEHSSAVSCIAFFVDLAGLALLLEDRLLLPRWLSPLLGAYRPFQPGI